MLALGKNSGISISAANYDAHLPSCFLRYSSLGLSSSLTGRELFLTIGTSSINLFLDFLCSPGSWSKKAGSYRSRSSSSDDLEVRRELTSLGLCPSA